MNSNTLGAVGLRKLRQLRGDYKGRLDEPTAIRLCALVEQRAQALKARASGHYRRDPRDDDELDVVEYEIILLEEQLTLSAKTDDAEGHSEMPPKSSSPPREAHRAPTHTSEESARWEPAARWASERFSAGLSGEQDRLGLDT